MVGQHLVFSWDENLTLPAVAHRAREVGSPRGCGVHPGMVFVAQRKPRFQ